MYIAKPPGDILDDVFARILILDDGQQRCVLVSVDCVMTNETPGYFRSSSGVPGQFGRYNGTFLQGTRENWAQAAGVDERHVLVWCIRRLLHQSDVQTPNRVSTECVGMAMNEVEADMGGTFISLFTQGFSGDVAPILPGIGATEDSYGNVKKAGHQLYEDITRAVATAQPIAFDGIRLVIRQKPFQWKLHSVTPLFVLVKTHIRDTPFKLTKPCHPYMLSLESSFFSRQFLPGC